MLADEESVFIYPFPTFHHATDKSLGGGRVCDDVGCGRKAEIVLDIGRTVLLLKGANATARHAQLGTLIDEVLDDLAVGGVGDLRLAVEVFAVRVEFKDHV